MNLLLSFFFNYYYYYFIRGETKLKMMFSVLVSREKCPEPLETRSISQGVSDGLPCKLEDIFRLNNSRNVRWMKVCPS